MMRAEVEGFERNAATVGDYQGRPRVATARRQASRRRPRAILPPVTEADVIAYWRKRARENLDAARLLHERGHEADALFHCHLAVERALKAAIMEKTGKPHPKIHELWTLAKLIQDEWGEDEQQLFDSLSDVAIAARYDDPSWAERQAKPRRVEQWIASTDRFLSSFLP